jgi:hypothetical protein
MQLRTVFPKAIQWSDVTSNRALLIAVISFTRVTDLIGHGKIAVNHFRCF